MPTTRTTLVYEFSELSPEAQERAVEGCQAEMAVWLDPALVPDTLTESIGFKLGHHHGGLGEPLAAGIELGDWEIGGPADYVELEGTLYRDTTPNLPWPDDCDRARFGREEARWTGNRRGLWLTDSDPEWMADDDSADAQAFWAELDAILADAVADARSAFDWETGEENARLFLEDEAGAHYRFLADGTVA